MLDKKILLGLVTLILGVASCGGDPEPVYPVGAHRLALEIPEGWEHAVRGGGHVFQFEGAIITIADLGVIDEKKVEAGARAARDLWREGRLAEAAAMLESLDLERVVATDEQLARLKKIWPDTGEATVDSDPKKVEKAYGKLLELIADLPEIDLAELQDGILWSLGETRERGVAGRDYREVNGHRVLVVDTWTRMDHSGVKRFALFQDNGFGLAVYTEKGNPIELKDDFDALVASIRFAETIEAD